MKDQKIETRIQELVGEEHRLRERLASGEISAAEEHARLAEAEAALDRMWDLLRQRRALRDSAGDPDKAKARPVDEVEHYLQQRVAAGSLDLAILFARSAARRAGRGPLAQLAEQRTFNPRVVGSSPTGPTPFRTAVVRLVCFPEVPRAAWCARETLGRLPGSSYFTWGWVSPPPMRSMRRR